MIRSSSRSSRYIFDLYLEVGDRPTDREKCAGWHHLPARTGGRTELGTGERRGAFLQDTKKTTTSAPGGEDARIHRPPLSFFAGECVCM